VADYVAFLRAINLGKNRKFPMAELRALLASAGFEGVETYIQTGNVRLRSTKGAPRGLEERLEELFEADRGFAVPTIVLTVAELAQVYADAAGLTAPLDAPADGLRRYVTLLKDVPDTAAAAEIEALSTDDEAARVRGRAVHLWMRQGYQNARLGNARVEKLLGVATTRDLKVVTALAQRWAS
jgi:uncharacterized protein (DUF1697 family)